MKHSGLIAGLAVVGTLAFSLGWFDSGSEGDSISPETSRRASSPPARPSPVTQYYEDAMEALGRIVGIVEVGSLTTQGLLDSSLPGTSKLIYLVMDKATLLVTVRIDEMESFAR